jgi:hypothetical protein
LGAKVSGLKPRIELLEVDNRGLSEAKELHPQSQEAPRLSHEFGGLITVVGLRGGSRVTGGLSARGLANVAVPNWSDHFTFIVGDHHYRCPSSIAQFLSLRVSELHSIDATISELKLEVENRGELFGSGLRAAGGGSIAVDSAHWQTFAAICVALPNSELYRCVCPGFGAEVTMENVVDRLRFLSTTQCDISTEIEFLASHFYDFLCRCDAVTTLPLSLLYEILGHGPLRFESEDSLYDSISKSIETNRERLGLLEFIRLEYCSTDVMNDLFDLLSNCFCGIDASIWANIRARLVLSNITQGKFSPFLKKRKVKDWLGN